MKPFSNFRDIKYLLIVVAAIIAAASLFVSNNFVEKLKLEEKNKMQVWASAMSSIINAELNEDVTLEQNILSSNKTIPVVLTDDTGSIIQENNIKIPANADSLTVLMERVADMRKKGNVIPIYMDGVGEQYVCYDDSNILILLSYYPYIQLCVVLIFLIICVVAVVSSKRAEQNRVWVGLSKETAHQLGTPISSLMAWVEVLKDKYPDDELLPDMSHDVERLQRVAERFSKIGSKPEHSLDDIVAVVEKSIEYVKRRSPSKVEYVVNFPKRPLTVRMNTPLIEWVIENLCKNAVDAMEGNGVITVTVSHDERNAYIDVADTGKGISKSNRKMVFEPGFTTKKRGWGLGLSLAKRIMEEYHDGKIFVKKSVPGKGTTFRMELKK
ncbi:MAG: HAMP domain-containing histidine kinase [Bacteroidaceae bacterium]|nr:HAMP domain-containing histidine kinase [Bacteroidaceae bacterium]